MTITEDYRDGYKAGHADKLKNFKREEIYYGWFTEYSQGYRDGWDEGRTYVN